MPLNLSLAASTGRTLFASLTRLSDGWRWNHTASAWQAAPALADLKIPLAEGAAENAGNYTASVSGTGDAGEVRVQIHDDADGDITLLSGTTWVLAGSEVTGLLDTSVAGVQTALAASIASVQASVNTVLQRVTVVSGPSSGGDPAQLDLTMVKGDLREWDFFVTDEAGDPVDITDWSIWFTAKERYTDADPGVFQLAVGSGITLTNPAAGEARLTVLPAHTAGVTLSSGAGRELLVDLQVKDPDEDGPRTLARGKLRVLAEYTKAS